MKTERINVVKNQIMSGTNYPDSLLREGFLLLGILCLFPIVWWKSLDVTERTIFILLQVFSIIGNVVTYVLTSKQRTVKRRLYINLVLPFLAQINSFLLILFVFVAQQGFKFFYFTFVLPAILFAIFFCIRSYWKFNKSNETKIMEKVKIASSLTTVGIIGSISGVFGMNFAEKYLSDVSQETVSIVLLAFYVFASCLLSISTANIVKLYYLKKFQKEGIDLNRKIEPGVIYGKTGDGSA